MEFDFQKKKTYTTHWNNFSSKPRKFKPLSVFFKKFKNSIYNFLGFKLSVRLIRNQTQKDESYSSYVFNLNVLELSILFIVLVLTYLVSVDDNEANDDPSWITLDEIVGMSLVTIASPSRLLPLLAGFLVFRLSDIMKQPKFVAELEKHPGKLGVLYDDLGAGLMGLLSATVVNQIINLTL